MREYNEKNSTPDKIDELLAPDARKKVLRYLFLIIGLVLVSVSVVPMFAGIDIGVSLTVGLSAFNLSPILYFLVLFLGLWLTAKFFTIAPYQLRENSLTRRHVDQYREAVDRQVTFFSLSHSRLAATLLFLTIAIVDIHFLTLHIGTPAEMEIGGVYNGTGTAVVLGGVSFFYPVGLPLLIAGVSLAIYLAFARFYGRFARSDNFLYFHEFRIGVPWLTEIPRAHLEAVRYQNTHLGPKVLWACFLVPYAIMVLQYGIPLFNQPRAETDTLPIMMTLSAMGAILAIIPLLFWPQDYFEIASKAMLYEMWLAPTMNMFGVREQIIGLLGFSVPPRPERKRRGLRRASLSYERTPTASMLSGVSPTQREFTQVLLGAILLFVGLLGAFANLFFGMLFWAGAATYGTFLLARGTLSDFSNRDGTKVTQAEDGAFQYARRFFRKFQFVLFPKTTSVTVENRACKLEAVDIIAIAWIVALGVYQTVLGWIITDITIPLLLWEAIGTTLVLGLIVLFVVAYFIVPSSHIVVKSATITHAIPVSSEGTAWGTLRHLKFRAKKAWQDPASRKAVLFRVIVLTSISIIAAVVAAIALFV